MSTTTGREFSDRQRDMGAILVITVAIVVLYAHTLNVPWYFDDFEAIVGNPLLRDLDAAVRAFGRQRWVAQLSFAINYRFGGLQVEGYHIVNIGIHLGASALAYLLLKRIFPGSKVAALFGALLFAVHPLQTQAITYVVQRMASLCGLFFLTSLYLFVLARERLASNERFGSIRHLACYGGSLLAAVLAIFTKENAVVLPFALLLFGRFFPPPGARPLRFHYLLPFLLAPVLLAVQALLLPLAVGDEFAKITGFYRHGTSTPLRYLATEFTVIWIYLRLLFLPFGQALDYGYPLAREIVTTQSVVALTGLIGLAAVVWRLRHRRPLVAFGLCWFLLTLAVESSVIPLDPIFEHRLYLPMFGFAAFIADLLQGIVKKWLRLGVMAMVLLVLSVLAWQRNDLWNDPIAFYEDNLRHAPGAQVAWGNLFKRYLNTGRLEDAERLLEGERFTFFDNYLLLGRAWLQRGEFDKARRYGEAALSINPAMASAYELLADAARHQQGEEQAAGILRRGIEANPGNLELRRQYAGLRPGDLENRFALADILYRKGRRQEAMRELVEISLADPKSTQALFTAGGIAFELGDQAALQQIMKRLRVVNPAVAADLEGKINGYSAPQRGVGR